MKFIATVLVLLASCVTGELFEQLGRSSSTKDPMYVKFKELLESDVCKGKDPNDLSEEGMVAWDACKTYILDQLKGVQNRRGLGDVIQLLNDDNDGEQQNGTAADFADPCYPLPPTSEGRTAAGWQTDTFGDDSSEEIDLNFIFKLYDKEHQKTFISANGILTFGSWDIPFFLGSDLPNFYMDMVAPFWADADPRPQEARGQDQVLGGGYGQIWWQDFGDHFAVVWDSVGAYNLGNPTKKRNTFQVVISDGDSKGRLGPANVCFCYIDMDWWEGITHQMFETSATVGLSSADDLESYVQVGRFAGKGDSYTGPFGEANGVDWLDYKGSNLKRAADQVDPVQGLCFHTGLGKNIPPVVSGFPKDDTYFIPCRGNLNLTFSWATPEVNQEITVVEPSNLVELQALGLVYTKAATTELDYVTVNIVWTPTGEGGQSGTHNITFFAKDNFGANVTRTLSIVVAECGGSTVEGEFPEKCDAITGNTCTDGDPEPFCTPFRSPEHCPMDESFPSLIRARNQIVANDPEMIEGLGYWFHHLSDKAAAYAFTESAGYHAPKLLCCASPSTWTDDCFGGANSPTSFVIRAVGDQHSNSAVYVLPDGFGGEELTRPVASMTMEQVQANIASLSSPATKIIVEEFVSGDVGAASLPDEYKIHAFNGEIGSIAMVLNRNSDCSCYAEVDLQWNRLDKYGCFVPNMPFGKSFNDVCYDIDFSAGGSNPYPLKGQDLCGKVPRPTPSCLIDSLVFAAQQISEQIGVYVRIDFFVGGDGKIYIQEYTFNHNNGLRHCSAKMDTDTGCIDSCFMGRMWKANGATEDERVMGGPLKPKPSIIASWATDNLEAQCGAAVAATSSAPHTSCGN